MILMVLTQMHAIRCKIEVFLILKKAKNSKTYIHVLKVLSVWFYVVLFVPKLVRFTRKSLITTKMWNWDRAVGRQLS